MKRSSTRLVPAALAAILVLGACGGSDDAAGDPVDPPAATTAGGQDTGLLAPTPIRVASGGAQADATSMAAESAVASDRMMMPVMIADYVVGDTMPALPTNDTGWVYQAGVDVGVDEVTALASSLGIEGEPQRIDDGYSVSWHIGPDDGSAASLWVSQDAQHSWSYSAPWGETSVSAGCAVAVAPDGTQSTDECVAPPPPAGIISGDEAQARLTEMIVAAGQDPAEYEFEVYADDYFASASAVEQLDGGPNGRRWDAGYGADGVMQYASGQLAEPVQVGPYPLIDLDTAIARLQEQGSMWGGGGIGMATDDMAVMRSTDVVTDVAPPAIAVGEPTPSAPFVADEPPSTITVDPMPVDVPEVMPVDGTLPAPEPVTVTLVDVQADVWWAWDVDGSVWLLPAYRFIDTDGGWHVVPAVTDEFLVQVEPPVDTPVDAPVDSPKPLPEPMPVTIVPPVGGGSDPGTPTETTPLIIADSFDTTPLEQYVGSTLDEFMAQAKALGASVRVGEQDGEPLAVTMDYSPDRVNVAVKGDVVVSILGVG